MCRSLSAQLYWSKLVAACSLRQAYSMEVPVYQLVVRGHVLVQVCLLEDLGLAAALDVAGFAQ